MASYEAFYGRPYRSPVCWDEVRESQLIGLELVEVTIVKIRVIKDNLLNVQ